MRRFALVREHDASGVSGTGTVAFGVEFADGAVALRWVAGPAGSQPATGLYACIGDVEAIHGHGGATRIAWLDVA